MLSFFFFLIIAISDCIQVYVQLYQFGWPNSTCLYPLSHHLQLTTWWGLALEIYLVVAMQQPPVNGDSRKCRKYKICFGFVHPLDKRFKMLEGGPIDRTMFGSWRDSCSLVNGHGHEFLGSYFRWLCSWYEE